MTNTFEIYWEALTEQAKVSLIQQGFIFDENTEEFPLFILHQEDIEEL